MQEQPDGPDTRVYVTHFFLHVTQFTLRDITQKPTNYLIQWRYNALYLAIQIYAESDTSMSQALFKEETPELNPDTRKTLISHFLSFMDNESVLREDEDLFPYESDGLAIYRQKPPLVVLPETIEQVQSILNICHELKVPVVARGAGTGLSGGALPLKNGIILGLAKFNKICLLYTSPSPRDKRQSRMPSSA